MVSLNGEEDVAREYMSSTGMTSSLYESTVWEELTGYESVSTISVLAKAQEENIDILLISSINLDTEIEKLNTDEATRQSVINAVNRGMVVTIPAEEILESYIKTKGAGSHAEVYAVNEALLRNPNATKSDILVYVNRTLGTSKPVTEIPFPTCPHCRYILEGFTIISDGN